MKLVFEDSKSHKFWNIAVKGKSYTVTYGKVGTKGQSKTKSFENPSKCKQAADKLIKEKLGKGYQESSGETAAPKGKKAADRAGEMFAGLLKDLGGEPAGDHQKVTELEKRYNLTMPADLKRLFNTMLSSGQGISMREWRMSVDEITPDLGKKNQFERIVELDQGNYLGTWMLELFTNSVYLGQLGNGDCYYAALKWIGSPQGCPECEINYFNHETYDLEFPFADSVAPFAAINLLHDGLSDEEEFDSKALKKDMQALKKHLNLSWHFGSLTEVSEIEPSFEGSNAHLARWLMARALWVVYLLRSDGVTKVRDLAGLFNLIERKPIEDFEAWISQLQAASPVSVTYWLWEFFFFNKTERLERCLEAFKIVKSPLVQDCIKLVSDLHSGKKKSIGKIKDINKLREEFLELDLDPDRAGERAQEQKAAKKKEAEKKGSEEQQAKEIIKQTPLEKLPDVAWEHLDNPVIVDAIYQHLRKKDKSLKLDFERADFVKEERYCRNNLLFRFESDEIVEAFFDGKTRLAPWLLTQGWQVFGRFPQAAGFISGKLKELMPVKSTEALEAFPYYHILPHLELPELEDEFLQLLPEKVETGDLIPDLEAVDNLKFFVPLLAKMKSKKLVQRMLDYVEMYEERMLADDSTIAARARNHFYDSVAPVFCEALGDVGDAAGVPLLHKLGQDSRLSQVAMEALIGLGDSDVLPELDKLCGRQLGVMAKTLPAKVMLAYALHKAGKKPETGSAKAALKVVMSKQAAAISLFGRAIEIVAGHCPQDEARELIYPFLEDEYVAVRRAAREALTTLGEDLEMVYLDRAHVDLVYKKKGKQALLKLLKDPQSVFKHNVLRKLADEKEADGVAGPALEYMQQLTRFDFYTNPYTQDEYKKTNYAISALAALKDKQADDFLVELMGHHNVMYRSNDLFKYKNHPHSKYLAKQMQNPPEPRPAPVEQPTGKEPTVSDYGAAAWLFGAVIHGVAFSPDAKLCAVVGPEKSAVYDADGKLVHVLIDRGHAYDVDYHPAEDLVAVGYHAGHLHLYDTQSGRLKGKLVGHGGVPTGVRKLRFSPDGKKLASVSDDRTLRIWSLKSEKTVAKFGFKFDVNGVDWFPDGNRVVVGTDKTAHIVDLKKKKVIANRDTGPVADVRVFDAGGKMVIGAGGGGKGFYLLDEKLKTIRVLKQASVARLRFEEDGSAVYAASWDSADRGVSRWELPDGPAGKKGKPKRKKLPGLDSGVFGMGMHPGTKEVYAGGHERVVHHWSSKGENATPDSIAHKKEISGIHYSLKTGQLTTACENGRVIRWTSPAEGRELFSGEGVSLVESMTVSADDKLLGLGASDKLVTIKEGGKPVIRDTKGRSGFVKFMPDGQLLASVNRQFVLGKKQSEPTNDRIHTGIQIPKYNRLVGMPFLEGYFTVWDFKTLKIERHVKIPVKTHGGYAAALSNDQERLYVSCSDEVIRIYDTQSWGVISEIFRTYSGNQIALSPDDSLIASTYGAQFELHGTKDYNLLAQKKLPGKVEAMEFIDQDTIVCGFESGGLVQVKIG